MLKVGKRIIEGSQLPLPEINTYPEIPEASAYDLIICANSLNEIERNSEATVLKLLERLTERGTILILEPGLRETTRRLMRVRDLVRGKGLSIIFPCTRQDPCPMLRASESDWCHGTLLGTAGSLRGSALVPLVDELTGFNKHRLKYSVVICSKLPITLDGIRVLRTPEKSKRGLVVPVCGPGIFGDLVLPKRARNDNNRALDRAGWYERITISPLPEGMSLSKESVVTREKGSE